MKSVTLIFCLSTFTLFAQTSQKCFEHSDPLAYDIGERITFADSTFEYEFVMGLAGGIVSGTYIQSGDSLILNSAFHADDYLLSSSLDSTFSQKRIEIVIKMIEHSQVIDVRTRLERDSIEIFEGNTIWHSNRDPWKWDTDTVLVKYLIPQDKISKNGVEVIVWRKDNIIPISTENGNNAFYLDLTDYPDMLDYRFFDNKYAVIKKNELFFLDDKYKPEKDYYLVQTSKGIKVSNKKKKKAFRKCKR